MDIAKPLSIEAIKNAMDLTATMAVTEIASDMDLSPKAVLPKFLVSHTGKMLYDDSLKLWWDGPSAVAEQYEKEIGWIK